MINSIGSFEKDAPAYWMKGTEPGGTTLSWAKDEFLSMGRALKIKKDSTSAEAAMWKSKNMVDLWSERHFKNVDILMGTSYKTQGVNSNPADDTEKWYVTYTCYDENDGEIGQKKLELDQSSFSMSGWVTDTTDVGEISLPEDAYKTIIRFVAGKMPPALSGRIITSSPEEAAGQVRYGTPS